MEYSVSVLLKDGETYVIMTTKTEYNVDIPEKHKDFCSYEQETNDLRSVTIIFEPDTENEKTVTKKLQKGAIIDFSYNEEYEETLYSDRACTTAFEDADLNADITVYAKKRIKSNTLV